MCAKDFRPNSGKPDGPRDPKKGKANWRGKGKVSPGRKPRKKGVGWTDRGGQEYRQAKFWYRVKIGAWIGLLVAALAAYIHYVPKRPETTPFLAMALTDYGGLKYFVPPNGWAREDLEHFELLGGDTQLLKYSSVDYLAGEPREKGFRTLREKLAQTKPGGPYKKLVVVYLSMHGAVNSKGQACLLAPHPEVSPYDADTWLPLSEVIVYLFGETRAEKKLLILDCNRMDANWRLGLLYNGFADRLQDALDDAKVPRLFILNSTSPGQVGWTNRRGAKGFNEFEGSVFAHYLWEGLAGHAQADGNEISLLELSLYVTEKVEQWVKTYRYDFQTPMLVPNDPNEADKVDVVFVPDSSPSLPQPSPGGEPRWKTEVAPLWKDHHRLSATHARRLGPLRWARFEQQLLRLEQLLDAGQAYKAEYQALQRKLAGLVNDFDKDRLAGDVAAYSLPLANRFVPGSHSTVNETWPAFLEDHSKERWRELLAAIDEAGRPPADVVELHFVRMINSYLDPQVWDSHLELVERALSVRNLAERAAAPDDVRAHYSIQSLVNRADQKRRQAEDRLFIGSSGLLEKAEAGYVEIAGADPSGGTYTEALSRANHVRAAYAARDEAWATIPFLAQWLLDRRYEPLELSSHEDSLEEKLEALIDDTRALDKKLDESLGSVSGPGELDSVERIQDNLDELRKGLMKYAEPTDVNDSKRLKPILVALDTPLVTGPDRAKLRDRYLARVTGSEESPADDHAEHLERIGRFPMLAMLDGLHVVGSSAPTRADDAQKAHNDLASAIRQRGEHVRGLLGGLVGTGNDRSGRIADEIDKTVAKFKAKSQQSPADARAGLSRADRLVRAAAIMIAPTFKYPWEEDGEPAERLGRLDLHYLMLWHGYRSLEDFWGPRPDEPGSDPYFQIVTGNYLQSAQKLVEQAKLGKRDAALRYEETDLTQLLENRAASALLPEDNNLKVDNDLEQFSKPSPLYVSVTPGQYLPKGEAAIYLVNPVDGETIPLSSGEDLPPDVRRTRLEVGNGKTDVDKRWVAKQSLPKGVIRLSAVALYRGHREPSEISVEVRGAGIRIVFQPDEYRPPVITVHGEATEGYSIMFILDCSRSMEKTIDVTVDNNPRTLRRFDVARGGLRDILSFLADRKDSYNVGLLAYGHRAGWIEVGSGWEPSMRDPDTGDIVLRPPDQFLLPGDDVQSLLTPGPFGRFEYTKISRELDKLQPMGETPLYYAIWMAADALSTVATPTKRIIVVTDGVNEQYPGQGLVPYTPFKVNQSLKNLDGQVHLDVVEFDIDENVLAEEKRKELDALRKLATDNGGDSYPARQPAKLVEVLEKALRLSHYYVESERGGRRFPPFPEKGYQLGEPAEIEQAADAKVRYSVRFEDGKNDAQADVELQGGEDLALFLTKDREDLEHRRYREGVRADQDDVSDPSGGGDLRPASFYIAAHTPKRDGDSVRFQFSLQNQEETQFSPRPAEAWIQVRPLLESGSPLLSDEGRPSDYIFYDLKFKEARPVPVIERVAHQWPAEATKAKIELFFKLEPTEPKRENVRQVGDLLARGGGFKVAGVPDVLFQLETRRGEAGAPYQVSIFETYSEDNPGLDVVKVEMNARPGRQPPPNLVEHRFNFESNSVRHTFYYDDALAADIDGYNVTFTPRTDLSRGAITLREPLVVTIPGRER